MRIDEFKKAIGAMSGVDASDQAVIVARVMDNGLMDIEEAGEMEALDRLYRGLANAAPTTKKGGNL